MLVGDHIKVQPIHDAFYKMKIYKEIFKTFFSDKMSYYEFDENLKSLCIKGLISFTPANINIINNISSDSEKRLLDFYNDLEVKWKEQSGLVRLTFGNERTITGEDVFNHLLQTRIQERNQEIQKKLDEIEEITSKTKNVEKKLDNINNQYISTMAIFIAVFTIFAGNSAIFKDVTQKNSIELTKILLTTNGTILLSIGFLFIILRFMVLNQRFYFKQLLILALPIILFIIAIYL